MDIEEALKIKNSDIAGYLKLPPVKLHCSMLAEEAIKKAIQDLNGKSAPKWLFKDRINTMRKKKRKKIYI